MKTARPRRPHGRLPEPSLRRALKNHDRTASQTADFTTFENLQPARSIQGTQRMIQEFTLLGGSWISGRNSGTLRQGGRPVLSAEKCVLPPPSGLFPETPGRYGRFDDYTRLGCAAAAMAVRDAGLEWPIPASTGIVVSTRFECLQTDLEYYGTTLENEGMFTSPNLFSYTLPGIVLGECAILFKLRGPAFTVGESGEPGFSALETAMDLLQGGMAKMMAAGWLDVPPPSLQQTEGACQGAVFVILSKKAKTESPPRSIRRDPHGLVTADGAPVRSLLDLFGPPE